jgi:HD-GYP domain-containing protein (c-di-GMP phosphodiesterase class II)
MCPGCPPADETDVSVTLEDDPAVERLLETNDRRRAVPPAGRELRAELAAGLALAAATAALVAGFGLQGAVHPARLVLLLVVYAVVGRVKFEIGAGYTTPIELVFVPLAFTLPPALLPAVVVAGILLHWMPDVAAGRAHPLRLVVHVPDAWHAVGPALVLCLAGAPHASAAQWPIFVAVVAAQLAFDLLSSIGREWLVLGIAPALQARLMATVAAVDVGLAPIGFVVAMQVRDHPATVLAVLPLAALLMVFAREREARIKQALQLSGAYRGTALLMGDVLEADDAYTGGEHSRGVVAMAMAVGEELGLGAREQRDLEFAALLHDIGKLRIPNAILNKPGALTDEEWTIVRRHPADGQAMLERVGGRLTPVGRIVRAHHERMDGGGYPDGLVGEQIPLAARIISACDAYNAMTTDRSYRKALPQADAIGELLRCTPSQFDPRVVAALLTVVRGALSPEPAGGVADEDGVEDGVVHDSLLA